MTVTSLASQFSDVVRNGFQSKFALRPPYYPEALRLTSRLGQTVWCCIDAKNPSIAQDVYVVVKPVWGSVSPEYTEIGPVYDPIKRLDIVGSPSPFGSSISQMLSETWRFYVPAGARRKYAFFFNAEGYRFWVDSWFTDVDGNQINIGPGNQFIWLAVGSPHAAMTMSAPDAAGGES